MEHESGHQGFGTVMVKTVPGTSSAIPKLFVRHTSNATGAPRIRFVQGPTTCETVPTKSSSVRGVGHRGGDGKEEETVLKSVIFPLNHASGYGPDPKPFDVPDPPVIWGRVQAPSSTGSLDEPDSIVRHLTRVVGAAEAD